MDPVTFQGLNRRAAPEGAFGYNIPNLLIDHAMRNPHVTAGLLARREHQPERHLRRDASSTSWRMPPGRTRSSSAASCCKPEACSPCSRRRPKGRLRQAGAGRHLPRPRPDHGLRQLRRRPAPRSRSATTAAQDPPHRRGDRSRPRRQSGADRAAGRGLVRLRPVGAALRRDHGQGRRASSRPTSTPTTSCASTRCRRSRHR